ncbi:MAG: ATP-binding protein [Pseudomonadota bacterium]
MQDYDAKWFKSVLDAMHDKVLVKGTQSQILWANRAFLNFYDMTEDELYQLVDAEHSDPDNTLQYVIDDQTVVTSGAHLDIPYEVATNAKGDEFPFHTVKSPIFEMSRVVRTVGVSRDLSVEDIPKRDIDHASAKEFVAPLRALTRSFPNPMMMVDVKGRVLHTSPLWAETFGTAAISTNNYFKDVYSALDSMGHDIEKCLNDRRSLETTVAYPKNGASSRIYAVQISPWALPDGMLGGATVIATDISALHQKTAALQNANEELMQYAYRASHDLKGPITTVKGLAGLIVEDIESLETLEALENAKHIVTMMERLESNVKSILDLARADLEDTGKSTVDLHALVGEICDGLSANSDRAGVEIESRLDVRHVQSQPMRLRQIMENLIANGIRYHAPDRDRKFVRVRSLRTKDGVAIDIEDNGLGIPKDAGDRIFERFTRFNQDSEGSGLGLAIVKRNVDALSGRIDVKSSDQGTAFRVVVPGHSPAEERP